MKVDNIKFTESLADFILDMRSKSLEKKYLEQIQIVILDFLCAAYAGSKTETAKLVFNYFKGIDKSQTSSVLGFNKKLSHLNAAFVNGTIAHALDFDDGHTKGSVHPGSVIIPAVFAVAERKLSDNNDIIKAIIVGYEVTILVSSIMHPSSRTAGYHNTPVAGIFGAVSAVSYLLNLDKNHIIGALGSAISFAGGTFTFLGSGSEIKRLHPGIAARDAIISAELAKNNFLGPNKVFERENGAFQVFARGQINQQFIGFQLGETFEFMNLYFKPYPCCRHLHVIIDAVQKLKQEQLYSIDKIESIHIGVNKVTSYHNHKQIESLLDAQMSIPYVTAVALLDKQVTVQSFNIKRRDRFKIEQIMNKVNVFEDEECEKVYPLKRKTNISIKKSNEKIYSISYDGVKGEPPCPMGIDDVKRKFRMNCIDVLQEEKIEEIITKVQNLAFSDLLKV